MLLPDGISVICLIQTDMYRESGEAFSYELLKFDSLGELAEMGPPDTVDHCLAQSIILKHDPILKSGT